MTAQIGDSFIYDGNAYVIVAESLGKELFSPSEYGLKPTPFSTACRNGYWCNYEISDALYLQNLFIHCSNGKYPDINGKSVNIPPKYDRKKQAAESLLFGDNGYRIYGNLNLKILYTGKILVGSGFIHRYYIHVGYQRAIAYKKLLEFEFEEGRLKNVEDLSKKAREKRKKMEEMYRNNLGTPPNKFSTTDQGFSGVQEEYSSATSGIRTRKRYKIFSVHSDISKESTFFEEENMSCHYIGRAMDHIAEVVLDLYESDQFTKEGTMHLILTCRKGVNWCDGNEGDAIEGTVKRGYCGLCFEKKANLTNVFDNDLAYPKRYDVFQAYDDTAAHYWLCPECKNRVLDEFRETKK